MRKRGRIILAVVTLAVLVLTAWLLSPSAPPDPVYGGHRLSYWVLTGPVVKVGVDPWGNPYGIRLSTVPRIQILGPQLDSNAVPYLIQTLKTRDGPIRKAYIHSYPHFPAWLRSRLDYPIPAASRVDVAIQYLVNLGPAARPAIPELVRMTGTDEIWSVRRAAINALGDISYSYDDDAVECLKALSKHKNPEISFMADQALQQIYLKPAFEPAQNGANIAWELAPAPRDSNIIGP